MWHVAHIAILSYEFTTEFQTNYAHISSDYENGPNLRLMEATVATEAAAMAVHARVRAH